MTPKEVLDKMLSADAFSKWLGIEVLEHREGYCKIQMTIREEMVNGFGICHGGVPYAFADSALAFASNSYGNIAVALENNISYIKPVMKDDVIIAETEELHAGKSTGRYDIRLTNQRDELVAVVRGSVFRTEKSH